MCCFPSSWHVCWGLLKVWGDQAVFLWCGSPLQPVVPWWKIYKGESFQDVPLVTLSSSPSWGSGVTDGKSKWIWAKATDRKKALETKWAFLIKFCIFFALLGRECCWSVRSKLTACSSMGLLCAQLFFSIPLLVLSDKARAAFSEKAARFWKVNSFWYKTCKKQAPGAVHPIILIILLWP